MKRRVHHWPGKKGVFLVGVMFMAVALAVGTYSATLSLRVATRNINNKELVMHAHMGAETAIEMGLRMLNGADSLVLSNTLHTGSLNDCHTAAAPVINGSVLTAGQYLIENLDTGLFPTIYKVSYAVNMDLSASALLSQSAWISATQKYIEANKNEGYPQTGQLAPNVYSNSATAMKFTPACYNESYLRLLRAEAVVVRVGGESATNPFRRRVAAIVAVDPNCTDIPFTGYGGCKAEVVNWYEE